LLPWENNNYILNTLNVSVFLPLIFGIKNACSVLYCPLWPVWFYHIFSHFQISGTIFREKVFYREICVLIFVLQICVLNLLIAKFVFLIFFANLCFEFINRGICVLNFLHICVLGLLIAKFVFLIFFANLCFEFINRENCVFNFFCKFVFWIY